MLINTVRALELSSRLALRTLGEGDRVARRLFIVDIGASSPQTATPQPPRPPQTIGLDPDDDADDGLLNEDPAVYVVVDGEDGTGHDKDDLDSRRASSSAVLIRDARWPRWRWCSARGFCSTELNVVLDRLLEGPVGDTSTDAARFLT